MKYLITLVLSCLICLASMAQVGVGTTTPTSTLDVRGSLAVAARTFSGSIAIADNDHTLVFTGSAASTATLPDATACIGRIYSIKNFSPAASTVLTIGTVSGQTIDGLPSWLLDESN